jgi:hypothetical protein
MVLSGHEKTDEDKIRIPTLASGKAGMNSTYSLHHQEQRDGSLPALVTYVRSLHKLRAQ